MEIPFECIFLVLVASLGLNNSLAKTEDTGESVGSASAAFEGKKPRIVGGEETPKNRYPSIVSFYYKGNRICGGSIYDEEWVVSAQHCVKSPRSKYYHFIAGDHDLTINETTQQNVSAVGIIKHPEFNKSSYRNDIVLFQVKPLFVFNKFVQKVVLPSKGFIPTGAVTAVGWGRTSESGDRINILRHVNITAISREDCEAHYKSQVFEGSLCAGALEGGKDTCKGDSGGPLYYIRNGIHTLVGVTSWGYGCARPNNPGVYVNVTNYLDWMEENACTPSPDTRRRSGHAKGNKNLTSSVGRSLTHGRKKKNVSNLVKLTELLAESICNHQNEYISDKKITKVVKVRDTKKTHAGFFARQNCDRSSTCKPFQMV